MANNTLPENPQRIVLVNPTKYLGNLLLAGGLMQEFASYCQARDIELKIVIDESFRDLCEASFPQNSLLFFPRRKINQAGLWQKIVLYLGFVKQLRAYKADLAFNIEEDSATSHLTRLSGASFKLGCSKSRHKSGYDRVIPVDFENRPAEQEHRWFSYYDVFAALGMPGPQNPSYIKLTLPDSDHELTTILNTRGVDFSKPVVVLHASATKDYKKWPEPYFSRLCQLLTQASMQVVLLGAGATDREANRRIKADSALRKTGHEVVDLCDCLSLQQLAILMSKCHFMIGNDSGPFHLGSAVGVPGSVIFGPTNRAIWQPLGKNSQLIQGDFHCDPACSKAYCLHNHQCLKEITPERVFETIPLNLRTL